MVGAVHDVRFGDGWERQCGDSTISGADRLVFDYCRHPCNLLVILIKLEIFR